MLSHWGCCATAAETCDFKGNGYGCDSWSGVWNILYFRPTWYQQLLGLQLHAYACAPPQTPFIFASQYALSQQNYNITLPLPLHICMYRIQCEAKEKQTIQKLFINLV